MGGGAEVPTRGVLGSSGSPSDTSSSSQESATGSLDFAFGFAEGGEMVSLFMDERTSSLSEGDGMFRRTVRLTVCVHGRAATVSLVTMSRVLPNSSKAG